MLRSLLTCAALATASLGVTTAVSIEAMAQSFSCSGNLSAAERAICGHSRLRSWDKRVTGLYFQINSTASDAARARNIRDQRSFIRQRNRCGSNRTCIAAAYDDRYEQMRAY